MSHNDANDREFDALLAAQDSELARLYRKLPQAEPDARLDAAVLAMAHRALNPHLVAASRATPRRPRAPAWLLGLGSAAGVVMAAGIAWQMRSGFDEHTASEALRETSSAPAKPEVIAVSPILFDAAPPAAPPPPPALEAPPSPKLAAAENNAASTRAASAAEKQKPAAEPEELQKRSEDRREKEVPAIAKRDAADDVKDLGAATPFPQGVTELDEAKSAPREVTTTTAGVGPGADAERQRYGEGLNSVERKSALAAGQRLDGDGAVDKAKKEQAASAEAFAADAIAPPAKPLAQMQAPALGAKAAPPAAPTLAGKPAPAAPPAASAPAPAPASTPVIADAVITTGTAVRALPAEQLERNAQLPARDWLALIQRMLRDGQRDEAIDNLELFRARHPDHRLPKNLRDLHR